jgi:hypothetical protein
MRRYPIGWGLVGLIVSIAVAYPELDCTDDREKDALDEAN